MDQYSRLFPFSVRVLIVKQLATGDFAQMLQGVSLHSFTPDSYRQHQQAYRFLGFGNPHYVQRNWASNRKRFMEVSS